MKSRSKPYELKTAGLNVQEEERTIDGEFLSLRNFGKNIFFRSRGGAVTQDGKSGFWESSGICGIGSYVS